MSSHLRLPVLLGVIACFAPASQAAPITVQTLQGPAKADTIHRLDELDGRRRIKPHDRLASSTGEYPSERLIFRDTVAGTVVWKMSRNPGYNYHTYSNILTWNADGTRMLFVSTRPEGAANWFVTPDGGRWTPFKERTAGWVYWSPTNPNKIIFTSLKSEIFESDLSSGRKRRLWDLSGEKGALKLFRPSHDEKKFLVRQKNMPVGNATHSFVLILNADGTGQPQRIDLGREAAQIWFSKRDDYSFTFNSEGSENFQWICEPLKNGAIRKLTSHRFYHQSVSPSGNRAAYGKSGSSGLWITDFDTGASRQCIPYDRRISSLGGGHYSWGCDDRWLLASAGNAIYEVQVDEKRARLMCIPNTQHSARAESEPESSPDGTKFAYNSTMMGDCDVYVVVQRLPDPPRNVKKHGRVLIWDAPERSRELAGYGIYRGSHLLNREPVRTRRYELPDGEGSYTVVTIEHSGLQSACPDQEAPSTPTGLAAVARSPFVVELTWQPSAATDISHYNVYCSSGSQPAAVQESRVASPGAARMIDWGLQADRRYHYIVTAVDRAGNESAPSAAVAVPTPALERVFRPIAVGKPLGRVPQEVSLSVPRDGRYLLWVELKPGNVIPKQQLGVRLDGSREISVRPMWDYVCTGHRDPAPTPFFDTLKSDGLCDPWYTLKAGAHRLELTLPQGSAEIVSLTLTNDAGFLPEGITRFRHERQP